MAEYSKFARGSYTSTGTAGKTIYLPFVPQVIRVQDNNSLATPTNTNLISSYWDASYATGSVSNTLWANGGTSPPTPYMTSNSFTTGGITTFSRGVSQIFGPQQQIVSATATNPVIFTVTAHGYSTGDVVVFEGLSQSSTTGMPQIAGMPFVVTVTGANTFAIPWIATGSNYTALSGSPQGSFVKKVLNPDIYIPGVSFISVISLGITTAITLTTNSRLSVGSTVAFRIPSVWGASQLNSDPNNVPPFNSIYGTVLSVSGNNITVDINSSAFNPFNVNIPVSKVSGLTFPQVVAVGDQNTAGGIQFVGGSATIGGPSINGAFLNNTVRGFTLGPNALIGTNGDSISWEAYYYDITVNG